MLVGLIGKAGSGKDTVAQFLVDRRKFLQYAFAYPLKALIMNLFDMSYAQLYSERKDEVDPRYDVSPRKLMQYLGTDVFRALYKDMWTDYFERWHRDNRLFNVVVSDVRFQNEADSVLRCGGVLWRVVRPGTEAKEMVGGASTQHASETESDSIETVVVLINDGTPEELYELVRGLV